MQCSRNALLCMHHAEIMQKLCKNYANYASLRKLCKLRILHFADERQRIFVMGMPALENDHDSWVLKQGPVDSSFGEEKVHTAKCIDAWCRPTLVHTTGILLRCTTQLLGFTFISPQARKEFLELKPFLCWFTVSRKKNELPPTWAMGAGWDLLGIQALEPCALN